MVDEIELYCLVMVFEVVEFVYYLVFIIWWVILMILLMVNLNLFCNFVSGVDVLNVDIVMVVLLRLI